MLYVKGGNEMDFSFDFESYEEIIQRMNNADLSKEHDIFQSFLESEKAKDSLLLDILLRVDEIVVSEIVNRFEILAMIAYE